MTIQFRKATKEQSRLRLSIQGPAKSGKTYTSLKIATEMNLGKIAVIDTERGSAAKYADQFEFDVFELDDFHPEKYIEAIHAAEKAGYAVLIIDSTTHEWNGRNGILELHEAASQRQKVKNNWTAWADITPLHMRFIDAILGSKCHVIASVRSKTEYVQDKNDRGQTEVRKVGMASIQREGMDYEYDIMIEMNLDHVGVIGGTRCGALDGKTFKKPGRELAEILVEWLTTGAEPAPEKKAEPTPPKASAPPPPPPAPKRAAPAPPKPTLALAPDPDPDPDIDPAHEESYEQARKEIIGEMREVFLSQDKTKAEWNKYEPKLQDKSADDPEVMLDDWRRAVTAKSKTAAAEAAQKETVAL